MRSLLLFLLFSAELQGGLVPATNNPIPKEDWLPGPFQKFSQPIMKPSAHGLDDKNVYNMAVVKDNGTFSMIYRGESKAEDKNECTGRLFLATSTDGVHFSRNEAPVFVGSESYESHGVEDPRIVKVGGTFYMTYSGYDGHIARLCLATSTDLRNWDKLGPMFPKFPAGPNGRFSEDWTKSGAILPEKLTSGRFAGEYVMVFGDTDLWLAHSKDMTHWDYLPDPVLRTRPEHHDRALVEPGPPLMLTKQGILLLYNSADEHNHYAMMGALFDAQDPTKLKKRLDLPFLEPTLNWEKTGYVPHVVFGEALIHDGDHWNLYYGGADHQIGLARAPFDPALLP